MTINNIQIDLKNVFLSLFSDTVDIVTHSKKSLFQI